MLFLLPGMPFFPLSSSPTSTPPSVHSLSYLQLILGTLLHVRHFLPTRQVSTPPVCSHRNNCVQTFPWSPSFCTLIVCVLICLSFCALHSWIQRMHRHTLAFLEVWHTFQRAQENNRGLAEVGDKPEGRERQMHTSQTKQLSNTVKRTTSQTSSY